MNNPIKDFEERWNSFRYRWHRAFSKVYYPVKDFFFPWNVIKLRNLPRSWCDTDGRMEEAVLQLLLDFFMHEQPFHVANGIPYEKNPSIDRHRELLSTCEYNDAERAVWERLLDIVQWYTSDAPRDGIDAYIEAFKSGGSHQEADSDAVKYENDVDDMLAFILKHRKFLWT